MLPIIRYPDPRLRTRSLEITEISEETNRWVEDLSSTMFGLRAVGIAAIQVGWPFRLFILDPVLLKLEGDRPLAFINPEILETSKEMTLEDEGCLCFPGITFPRVQRAHWVTVKAADLEGKSFEMTGDGLLAQAIQHEFDHLEGRLVLDRISPLSRKSILRKLRRG